MTIGFIELQKETPIVGFEYPVDELQTLFNNYNQWAPDLDTKGLDHYYADKRLSVRPDKVNNPSFTQLVKDLENSKIQLIEKFLDIDTRYRWPNMATPISKNMVCYVSLNIDLCGFQMGGHFDNRTVYAAGYLNVIDNESVTIISSTNPVTKKETQYKPSGKKGSGIIWLNTENSFHWVNTVPRDRHIILITYNIVPWG